MKILISACLLNEPVRYDGQGNAPESREGEERARRHARLRKVRAAKISAGINSQRPRSCR